MKFISTCPECQRLWREYSSATTAHIKLESQFNVAAISHDESTVIRLTPDVEDAARARTAARQLIRAHEAVAHPEDQPARDAARA